MREGLFRMTGTDPLVNPIVHGDGVGYDAYVRAPLIEQNLDSPKIIGVPTCSELRVRVYILGSAPRGPPER